MTSLLRHYYVIIKSLLRHHYKWRKCIIMSSLLPCNTYAVSIKILSVPIIIIITYYYVFETEQLADDLCSSACLYKPTIHTPCLPASRPQASRDSRPPGQTRCPSPTRPCPTRPAQLHLILPDPACPPTPPDLVRVRPPPTTSRAELWLLACAPSCTR